MYYKIFSWQENRSALPQGFSVTSFVKISFPFIWDPSCNFKCRAVFSENAVKVCNWVGKLIEESVIAHGLCLWKAETPGWAVGQQGFQPAPWQRTIGQVTLQSHLLSAVTGVSSFRRWTGSGDSSVWIRLPHNLPFSIFFFPSCVFFGRASNALAPLAAAGQQAVSCRGAEGRDSLILYPLTVRLCLNVYQTVGLLVLLLHLLMGKSLNLALKHV